MAKNIWRQCPSSRLRSSDIVDYCCPGISNVEEIADGFFEYRAILKTWNGSRWVPKLLKTFKNNQWVHKSMYIFIDNSWQLVRS